MASRPIRVSSVACLFALIATAAPAAMTETKLIDSNGAATHHLGTSVALDGLYAIAGAPYDTSMGANAGKAVIYHFNGLTWVQQAEIFPSVGPAEGRFGWSVDISGDLAVVGAPYHVATGTSIGLAYVFRRAGTNWNLDAVILSPDGALDDHFGDDVAIHGTTIAIGAPGHSTVASGNGGVYIYVPIGLSWALQAKLDPQINLDNARFGGALDVWGDWVAAASAGSNKEGLVHMYKRNVTTWSAHLLLQSNDANSNDFFGQPVALYDQGVLAGTNHHQHPPSSGAAYFLERNALQGSWPQKEEFLEVSIGNAPDNLGWSVGLEAGLAAVGAILADGIAHDSGLVYAYREDTNEDWHEVAAITASDGFEGQTFGSGVDVSGGCIIVGASTDDDQGQFAGAAYIYCGIPQLIFLVELDIICCIEIPDFTTGPVEFEIRFENVLSRAQTVRRWVDLVHPDGTVEQLIAPSETRVLPGTTHAELLEPTLRTGAAGEYSVVVYWDDGEGIHSEFQTISVVQSSLPGLSWIGSLILAALLLGAGHRRFAHRTDSSD